MAPGDAKNPLGQIAEETFEQLGTTASQTASQVVSEPTKVLEQILGGSPGTQADNSNEGWVEQGQTSAGVSSQTKQRDDEFLIKKQQESNEKSAALYQLHMKRLHEETDYYEKRKQEEAQKKQIAEHQEQQKEEIVQLQKEKQDDAVWQQQLKAVQGSHEGQQGKM